MLKSIKALVFDLDGTLVDSAADITLALNSSLSAIGLASLEPSLVRHLVGKGAQQLLRDSLQHLATQSNLALQLLQDQAKLEQLYHQFILHYSAINGTKSQLYPGVRASLSRLQQRQIPMACLTNKPISLAKQLLRQKKLLDFFQPVFGGDSFSQKKPHPLPLLNCCEILQLKPSQVLMVGDSINDLRCARAAGCCIALLSYGYNQGLDLTTLGADILLDSIADLEPHLPAGNNFGD